MNSPDSAALKNYVPPAGEANWATIDAAAAGFDAGRLEAAVETVKNAPSTWPHDIAETGKLPGMTAVEPAPWNEILGPLKSRGGPGGVILRHGRLAAAWGEPGRVEMTFSATKSYLGVLAGLAVGDGLIDDLDRPVGERIDCPEFAGRRNARVTWRQLLQQTSEWQGTLFDKPDQVDHHRQVGGDNSRKGELRALAEPGAYWEYNDVRVNVLALALLHLFRRPLPEILKSRIMDPIGASSSWQWHAYRNAIVDIDSEPMASVPGGAHWGGGLWISALDHARFGLLIQRAGRWGGQSLLPAGWVDEIRKPCPLRPVYGLLWWLNTDRAFFPSASANAYFAIGAGSHVIWIEPDLDLVLVARWIDRGRLDGVIAAVTAAVVV